ncbi:MAG TPA: energy transducer TonB [Terriglobales bacterium]|jgi:TonB family protein|nr:energy transducer TonB [Terriglobales bacterium]
MSVAQRAPVAQRPPVAVQSPVLPTLFGEGYGVYRARPSAFVFSYIVNVLVAALLVWSGHWAVEHHEQIKRQVMGLVTDVSPYVLPPSASESGGGGGGGDRDKLQASRGSPPRFAREQITPPAVVVRNDNPKLAFEPTVVGPPEIKLPQFGVVGDPLSNVLGPPSNGTGSGGGIGSGSGGGVGSGRGPGVGPGEGGGIGGGLYRVGGGVSAPRTLYAPEPEYSEEARKAKYQGTLVLWMIVGADGRPRDIRVARSLGMGLDEKALEAVRTWRFEPARKDGKPVAVQINVEVIFRLY